MRPSARSRQSEPFTSRGERTPCVYENLLFAVLVERNGNFLQRGVTAVGAKLFSHDAGGLEARGATQNERANGADQSSVICTYIETDLLEDVLHGKVGCHARDCGNFFDV